jgi:hypothetical protein
VATPASGLVMGDEGFVARSRPCQPLKYTNGCVWQVWGYGWLWVPSRTRRRCRDAVEPHAAGRVVGAGRRG